MAAYALQAERLQQRKAASRSPAAAAAALLREHGSPEAARFAASPGPGSLAVAQLAAAAEEAAEAPQPVEPLEETEARLPPGSVKHGIFQVGGRRPRRLRCLLHCFRGDAGIHRAHCGWGAQLTFSGPIASSSSVCELQELQA